MSYDNWKQQTPPSFYEKETETETESTVKCDLCFELFPEEEKYSLGSFDCVCPTCVIMNDENK